MRARELRRFDDALDRHARIGKRDILADGAVEQLVFLQHDADLTPQPRDIDHRKIDAVHQHPPAFGHIKPLGQLGESGFAGARRADDADDLACGNGEIDVVQNLRPIDLIAKMHMLEADGSLDVGQRRAAGGERGLRSAH